MKLIDIFGIIENKIAPVALSDELCKKYGHYDNSGILVENEGEITGVLFSLDFTPEAAEEAVRRGCNLLVTHHPAIYHGQKSIKPSDDIISRALVICIKNNIGVISMHLNFDSAPEGIDYYLMRGLGGIEARRVLNDLSSGGYGRLYDIEPVTFKDFVKFPDNWRDILSGGVYVLSVNLRIRGGDKEFDKFTNTLYPKFSKMRK